MFNSTELPKVGDVINIRRKGRGLKNIRSVVVTGVGRDSFLGFFVTNTVIENHFKPSEVEWEKPE